MNESPSPDEERLRAVFTDPSIDEISAEDLCRDRPSDRFDAQVLAERFGFREE